MCIRDRCQAHLFLAGQDPLAHRLVPRVEAAPVAVDPLLRRLVRGVGAARRVVEESGPLGGDGLDVVEDWIALSVMSVPKW